MWHALLQRRQIQLNILHESSGNYVDIHRLDDGHLRIDLRRRQVKRGGVLLELTPKEYAMLSRLAGSPGCIITQAQLLEEIWGPAHKADSHYLRIVVSHLRKKLEDDASSPRYLLTEPGVGYRLMFVAKVGDSS
jgi:two-component system KDP operon response regulator KdpE